MKHFRALGLAGLLATAVSAPAMADWDNIGRVHFDYGRDRSTAYASFAGAMDSLQFIARGSDVECSHVRATFGNGETRDIFNGHLGQGRPKVVDLPGNSRYVRRLDFVCRTFVHGGANVDIGADISRYREEWRRDPHWAQLWSRLLPPAPSDYRNHDGDHGQDWNDNGHQRGRDHWVLLGTQTFERGRDRQMRFHGWTARNVTQLALKPIDGDARCSRVSVLLGNNTWHNLDANHGQPMSHDGLYRLDLPGGSRDIQTVDLSCHAMGQYSVRIQIYANK